MTVIRYSAVKLLLFALTTFLAGVFFLCVLLNPDAYLHRQGRGSGWLRLIAEHDWLSGGIFALCFSGAVLLVALAFGERIALTAGPGGVEVRNALSRIKAGWADVISIGIEKSYRGAKQGSLVAVRLRRNGGEKKVTVAIGLLAHDRPELERLLGAIERQGSSPAQARAVRPQAAASMGFGRRGA